MVEEICKSVFKYYISGIIIFSIIIAIPSTIGMIIKVRASPLANKRFRAEVETHNGIKKIDFGFKTGYTYLDGASLQAKQNYWKRHLGNATEKRLIENLVLSPALLSAYLLWNNTRDLSKNIAHLNKLLSEKHLGK